MLITFACTANSCKNGKDAPDVSGIQVTLRTKRFDKDLAALDTNNIAAGLASMKPKYPQFQDFFLDTLMGFNLHGDYSDTAQGIKDGLRIFLTNKDYRGVFDTVAKHYPDTKDLDEQLTRGFKYLKHYEPDQKIPQVVYMLSWLNNWGAFTLGDGVLAIGLDMFLGANYPFYNAVGIPDYMAPKLKKKYIPVAAMRAIYQDKMPFQPEGNNLLHMMIQRGKEMYFIGKVLPFIDEPVRLAFTKEQLEWCKANEAMVYNFFVREDLLYSNDWQKVLRYVNDAPSATGMPSESPGNIGAWLGLQIVKAYAQEHPKMSLQELIYANIDASLFLQQSKYKPK